MLLSKIVKILILRSGLRAGIGIYWLRGTAATMESPLQQDRRDGRSFAVTDLENSRWIRRSRKVTATADYENQNVGFKWNFR
ncbi:hypothetical protein HAX54_046534, partial [Datura stramonium]|nr:hypothetical protein [Datura stramonium]